MSDFAVAQDHERIWLQPKCCAASDVGRLWCEDPDPEPCEDGAPWTQYVRADLLSGPSNGATADELTRAERDVLAERRAHVTREGWTDEHDDEHSLGEMGFAAACYALHGSCPGLALSGWVTDIVRRLWPWSPEWWKPSTRRRDLVKAGALILAEIASLDRNAARESGADAS